MTLLYFFYIFQRKRAGCKIAGIGIITFAFDDKLFEVGIGDDCLTTYNKMSLLLDCCRNATDGWSQVGVIGADMSITTRYPFSVMDCGIPLIAGARCVMLVPI